MAKRHRLRRLRIQEVSWVDKPANLQPFLFVKNVDGKKIEKAGPVKVAFELNKQNEVSLTVNKKAVPDLVGLSLMFSKEEMAGSDPFVFLSYTVAKGEPDKNGFQAQTTYRLIKGEAKEIDEVKIAIPATEEELAKVRALADVDDNADGTIVRELGSHAEVIAKYVEDLPVDLRKAISETVRLACQTQEVDEIEDREVETQKNDEQDPASSDSQQESVSGSDSNQQAGQSSAARLTDEDIETISNKITANVVAQLQAQSEADKDPEVEMTDEELAADLDSVEQEVVTAVNSE